MRNPKPHQVGKHFLTGGQYAVLIGTMTGKRHKMIAHDSGVNIKSIAYMISALKNRFGAQTPAHLAHIVTNIINQENDMETRKLSTVDKHVAARLKTRRREIALSQESLADAIGVTFQQVQKYENCANRISAGRLHQIATALTVNVSYFYEGLPAIIAAMPRQSHTTAQPSQ